jgi:acyl-CoA thioester hydrolase
VRYQIGLFCNDSDSASAVGEFVHVYVERSTNKPVSIPDNTRAVLKALTD